MAILDEIDSGLDVDALQDVAKAVNGLLSQKNSFLMITHYIRLLDLIKPTFVHVMVSYFKIQEVGFCNLSVHATTCLIRNMKGTITNN